MKWPRRETKKRDPEADASGAPTSALTETPRARSDAPVVRSLEEESHETITLVDLKGKDRDAKLGVERAHYDGAGELEFSEQEYRRSRPESIDDIRRLVDAIKSSARPSDRQPVAITRSEAPPEPAPPAEPEPAPAAAPEPEPAPEPVPAPAPAPAAPSAVERPGRDAEPLSDEERALVASRVDGALEDAVVLYRTDAGRLVEARTRDADGGAASQLFIIVNGELRDLSEVRTRADSLRPKLLEPVEPAAPEAEEAPVAAPEPEPSAAEPAAEPAEAPAKKGLFRRKKAEAAAPEAQPAEAEAKEDEKKSRLRMPFGKKAKDSAEATAPEPAESKEEKKSRLRVPFGKKAKAGAEAAPETPAEAAAEEAPEAPAKKSRLKLPFRKGETAEAAPESEAPAAPDEAAAKKGSRFSLRRKKH